MSNIDEEKKRARKEASSIRKQAFEALPQAGEDLCKHIEAAANDIGLGRGSKPISVFWSIGSEIDTHPLIEMLNAVGHTTALPIVAAKESPLIFRAWRPGELLVDGGFGTSIPGPDAPEVMPEFLFVPLLRYDDAGYRLGYGGGFYDRTLEKLRTSYPAVAVGVAFSAQRVDTVARGPHDQKLDWIATERGVHRIDAV